MKLNKICYNKKFLFCYTKKECEKHQSKHYKIFKQKLNVNELKII